MAARTSTSALYDVLNDIVIDAVISPYKTSEREMSKQHINSLNKKKLLTKSIVIFDRVYPSYDMFNFLDEKGLFFLIRVTSSFKEIQKINANDSLIEYKFGTYSKKVRVIKVELPSITELEWEKPLNLHFVPVDFTKEHLETALKRSAYDSKALSFFSWLGVTYYLPRDAVFATLRTIANIAPAGSNIIFDYYDTDAFVSEKVGKDGNNIQHRLVNLLLQALTLPLLRQRLNV